LLHQYGLLALAQNDVAEALGPRLPGQVTLCHASARLGGRQMPWLAANPSPGAGGANWATATSPPARLLVSPTLNHG